MTGPGIDTGGFLPEDVLATAAAVIRRDGGYRGVDTDRPTGQIVAEALESPSTVGVAYPVNDSDRIEAATVATWLRNGAAGADNDYVARVRLLLDKGGLAVSEAALLASAVGAARRARVRPQTPPPLPPTQRPSASAIPQTPASRPPHHPPPTPPSPPVQYPHVPQRPVVPPPSLRQTASPVWAWTVPICVVPTVLIWWPIMNSVMGTTEGTIFGVAALAFVAAMVGLGIGAIIGTVRYRRVVTAHHAIHTPDAPPPAGPPMSPGEQRREMWWAGGGPG